MKTRLIAAVTLSGALALAGCGTSAPAPSAATTSASTTSAPTTSAPTTSAPTTSAPTTSAPPSAGATIPATDLATRISAATVKARSGKVTLTSQGAPATQSVTGDLAFTFVDEKTSDSQGTISIAGQRLGIVTKGGLVYLKGLPAQLSGGKTWVKIDPNGTDAFSKAMKDASGSTGDPRAMVDGFKGGTAKVVDSVGGKTHYSVTGTQAAGDANATIDLTTDAKDLLSNITVVVAGQTVKMDYSDWGTAVTITVPPADQVGTVTLPKG